MLADISVFESLQNDAHASMGLSGLVAFNGYSDQEKLQKEVAYREEMASLKQESDQLVFLAQKARAEMEHKKQVMQTELEKVVKEQGLSDEEKQRVWQEYTQELDAQHAEKHFWRNKEIRDRVDTLGARVAMLKQKITPGAFADHCFEIENRINEFKMRIKAATEADQRKTMGFKDYKNMSVMAAFQ